jgi:spondin N
MQTRFRLLTLTALTTLGVAACGKPATEAPKTDAAPAVAEMRAATTYKVQFTPAWTKANFPFEYPDTSLIHKPHFSGWIGTAHDDNYRIFQEGVAPTPGLENLSEMGKHDPLDSEIKSAIAAGNALSLSESEPLKDFSQTVTFEVSIDEAHPMVALVAMIAPSPDWFAGVDVNLMENGAPVASKSVDVAAWDSGGDDGTTYLADDVDTNPKKPSMQSTDRHFMNNGKTMPVGTLTFTKM